MKPEMKAKILAYNRAIAEKAGKASDLDIIVAAFVKLPPVSSKSC